MKDQLHDGKLEPWYRQGWPWALIAIPLLTVIAGVTTFIIANNTSDSLVQDDYYKKGLAINTNLERVALAESLALIASIEIQTEASLISVILKSNQASYNPNQLTINFSHPTLESKDKSFVLSSLANHEYVGEFSNLDSALWHVGLEDEKKKWLIKSRWLYPNQSNLTIDTNVP